MKQLTAVMVLCTVSTLFLPRPSQAEAPTLTVAHTELTTPGDILRITASAEGVKSTTWQVWADISDDGPSQEQIDNLTKAVEAIGGTVTFEDTGDEKTYYLECDGGTAIDLPSWEGQQWVVFCCVANDAGDQADDLIEIQCPGKPKPVPPNPIPPIPPDPIPPIPPDPIPPIPVPVSSLTKIAAGGVKPVVTAANKVEFILLAGVYMSGAENAKSGKFSTVEALLESVKVLTYKAMPTSVGLWKPTAQLIEIELDRMRDAGTLDTTKTASYEQPFRDIAQGILLGIGVSPAAVQEIAP